MLRQRQVNNILLATQSGPQIPLATEVQGLDFELIFFSSRELPGGGPSCVACLR